MERTTRVFMVVLGLCFLVGLNKVSIGSITVTDDFNRSDGPLGSNWVDPSGNFYLINQMAVNQFGGVADKKIGYNGIDVQAGSFSVQANIYSTYSTEFVGLAFNIVDASNYYFARTKKDGGWTQVVEVRNGGYGSVFVNGASGWSDSSLMQVTGDGAGNFTVIVGSTPWYFTDTTPLTGGGLGLYYDASAGGGTMKWDNFSATYVPEPATIGLLCSGLLLLRRRG